MKKNYILFLFVLLLGYTASAQLIINEVLYDPPSGDAGDANGDGTRSALQDEFIEFYNTGSALDLTGYTVSDADEVRHTFPSGTTLEANGVLVLFGGGTPTGTFGGALVQTASEGQLNMSNSDDLVTVADASGNTVLTFDVEALSNNPDESYTRDPDITGDFVQHAGVAAAAGALFSPGTKNDGSVLSTQTFTRAELSVYPNPVINGILNITSPLAGAKTIALYDITGRLVKQAVLNSETLDLQTLTAGIYLLNISIEDKSSTTKLLIQ